MVKIVCVLMQQIAIYFSTVTDINNFQIECCYPSAQVECRSRNLSPFSC